MSNQKEARIHEISARRYSELAKNTDEIFAGILIFQWVAAICFAVFISPYTWIGTSRFLSIHVYAAVFFGGMLTIFPIYMIWKYPGSLTTRMINAVAQILYSGLLIHLSGGRIETHFHIFGSIAFLAMYRDIRPVLLAAVVTFLDHILRGIFWPQSVYAVLSSSILRAFEHGAWVFFESVILCYSIHLNRKEMYLASRSLVELEDLNQDLQGLNGHVNELNQTLEKKVLKRTRELEKSQKIILQQQEKLLVTAKMSELGEIASSVAHEINNPLGIIQGKSSLILKHLERGSLTEEMGKIELGKIVAMTERIAKIIKGLKSFSRDAEQDPTVNTSLESIVQNVLSFCGEKLKSQNIEVMVSDFSQYFLECRAIQIEQVLLNLLNNAHDALENSKAKWIKITAKKNGDRVIIAVSNSGPRIPSGVLDRIMQPFFTTKSVGKGTGLGLSISRRIIASHKGELRYDNTAAHTCFELDLPQKQPTAPSTG